MRKTLGVVAAAVALIVSGSTAASAEEPVPGLILDAADESALRAFFDEHGVAPRTQEDLLADLRVGDMWDSMGDAEPVATETTPVANGAETVLTYADGSIVVTHTPAPQEATPGSITPMNFGQCQVASSSSYHVSYVNCFVSASNGLSWASFRADYSKYSGAPAEIDWVGSEDIGCLPCTVSGQDLEIVRRVATSTRPATARLDWTYAGAPWGVPSGLAWLEMRVTVGGSVSTPNDVAPWST